MATWASMASTAKKAMRPARISPNERALMLTRTSLAEDNQQRANASQQFAIVERLGEIVVSSGIEAGYSLVDGTSRCQDEDGYRQARLAHVAQEIQSVLVRQTEIQHHEIIFHRLQRNSAVT